MSMKHLAVLSLGVFPFLVACGGGEAPKESESTTAEAPKAATAESGAKGTGSISGRILFEGTAPAPEKIKLSADPKCAEMHKDGLERESIRVKDGGLADVLVYVKSGASGTYPGPDRPRGPGPVGL